MTELSYTAWDDNKYQWPPPEGWYQASDGKWWPEGYGPVAGQATAGESSEASGSGAESAGEIHHESADEGADAKRVAAEFDAGYDAAVAAFESHDDVEFAENVEPAEAMVDAVAEGAGNVESGSAIAANGVSEYPHVAESDHPVDLDGVATAFDDSQETAFPTESNHDAESRYSTSSAGMAASGFAPRADGGSSSLGLAGWAQTGAPEVRNRVDVSHEYDYSAAGGEAENLLDPTEAPDGDHDVETPALDTPAHEGPDLDTVAVDASTIDIPAEPIDSTLSRLDDLKRQVEQQSFSTNVGAADTAGPGSDPSGAFDPTETLDIDPNDLTLESNPYYGGDDETEGYGTTAVVGTDEPAGTSASSDEFGVAADTGVDHGYDDRVETTSEGYGYSQAGEAAIDPPSAADTRQYGFEGEAPPPAGDPTIPMGDGYGAPQNDYSNVPALTPTSTPTPKPGRGRIVLYGIIALLALAVAGVAGYLLFQLQGDDGDASVGDAGTATVDGVDAGPSDLSGQEPGSFSNPHELAGGVRLTVPVADDGSEVWMLQVREPATASDMDDGLVEVTSRIRVRNDGTTGDLSASGLRFVLVSADGSTGTTSAGNCSAGDDLNRDAAIEPGKDIEGNVCWTVPAAQGTGALLGIESVHAGGRVHVQLS